jgi:hypothetical protein
MKALKAKGSTTLEFMIVVTASVALSITDRRGNPALLHRRLLGRRHRLGDRHGTLST